jgi:hypothetical protein
MFYSKLDVNFNNFIVTRNDCKTAAGAICPQKIFFNPLETDSEVEIKKEGKTNKVNVESDKAGISTNGFDYTDKVCLSATSAGCIPL